MSYIFLLVFVLAFASEECLNCVSYPQTIYTGTKLKQVAITDHFFLAITAQNDILCYGDHYPPHANNQLFNALKANTNNFSELVLATSTNEKIRNFFLIRNFTQVKVSTFWCGILSATYDALIWNTESFIIERQVLDFSFSALGLVKLFTNGSLYLNLKVIDVSVTRIAAHEHATVILLTKNKLLYSYGYSSRGLLGLGAVKRVEVPELVFNYHIVQMSISDTHALVLTESSHMYGFGSNEYGQISGSYDFWNKIFYTPYFVTLPYSILQVKACSSVSLLLTSDTYTLVTAGSNLYKVTAKTNTEAFYETTYKYYSVDCTAKTGIGISASSFIPSSAVDLWGEIDSFSLPIEDDVKPSAAIFISFLVLENIVFAVLSLITLRTTLQSCRAECGFSLFMGLDYIASIMGTVCVLLNIIVTHYEIITRLLVVLIVYFLVRLIQLFIGIQLLWTSTCSTCREQNPRIVRIYISLISQLLYFILCNMVIDVIYIYFCNNPGITTFTNVFFIIVFFFLYGLHLVIAIITKYLYRKAMLFRLAVKAKRKQELVDEVTLRLLHQNELNTNYGTSPIVFDSKLFEIQFDDLSNFEDIGCGVSGVVLKAKWKKQIVAVKLIRKTLLDNENQMNEFSNEISLLTCLRHPNVVNVYGALTKPPRLGYVMEYCSNKSLHNYINNNYLSFEQKLKFLEEIASGMLFLHSKQVIHRDLKSENILIDSNFSIKISDFGVSKLHKDAQTMTSYVGTSIYMAPEVSKGLQYTNKCDIFSFGIIMYEILFNTTKPYGNVTNVQIKVANDPSFRPEIITHNMPSWIISLMQQCWLHDPEERPNFSEILNVFAVHS